MVMTLRLFFALHCPALSHLNSLFCSLRRRVALILHFTFPNTPHAVHDGRSHPPNLQGRAPRPRRGPVHPLGPPLRRRRQGGQPRRRQRPNAAKGALYLTSKNYIHFSRKLVTHCTFGRRRAGRQARGDERLLARRYERRDTPWALESVALYVASCVGLPGGSTDGGSPTRDSDAGFDSLDVSILMRWLVASQGMGVPVAVRRFAAFTTREPAR